MNHWRLKELFWLPHVFRFEKKGEKRSEDRTHVSMKDRNREAEIKWALSTRSMSWMLWIPGMPGMFNWHIPLYKLRIIGIWLVAFVMQHVNYSWEKSYRPLWDGITSLTTNLWRRDDRLTHNTGEEDGGDMRVSSMDPHRRHDPVAEYKSPHIQIKLQSWKCWCRCLL